MTGAWRGGLSSFLRHGFLGYWRGRTRLLPLHWPNQILVIARGGLIWDRCRFLFLGSLIEEPEKRVDMLAFDYRPELLGM